MTEESDEIYEIQSGVKYGKDKKLEAEANKWLQDSVGENKRSPRRDREKMAYEYGLIAKEDLRYYDPENNWDVKDSPYSLLTDSGDMGDVTPSLCADCDDGNVRARSREDPNLPAGVWGRAGMEERRGLLRHVGDDDSWGSAQENIPPFEGNHITSGKVCTKCGLRKRLEYFSPDERNADKLRSWCKACRRKSEKDSYARKNR